MIYASIIVICAASVFIFACTIKGKSKTSTYDEKKIILGDEVQIVNDTIKPMFSKKQIEKKLQRLAKTPPPTDLAFGAMCYSPAEIKYENFQYICPVCGEKTIYETNSGNKYSYFNMESDISSARRETVKIKGINIKLDESQFCSHCRTIEVESPELCLLVNIAGESDTTKLCGISYFDINLLNCFLNDELKYKDDYDFESPLVDRIERIEQMIGIISEK